MNTFQTYSDFIPESGSFTVLDSFNSDANQYRFFSSFEKDFIRSSAYNKDEFEANLYKIKHRVERARSRWACITAKSQRIENYRAEKGIHFKLETFNNLTQCNIQYERKTGQELNHIDRSSIEAFTEKSRRNLIQKSRKINPAYMKLINPETGKRERVKEPLPLPYFVTLTYRENMREPKKAKKHLNVFFQRFRRLNAKFAYVWKMEPQERGAVHFHLALFIPEEIYPEKYKTVKQRKNWMQCRISDAWNDVTNQNFADETGLKCSLEIEKFGKEKEITGNVSLYAGTQVRTCDNWKMYIGYISHYMKKEVKPAPFGYKLNGKITSIKFLRPVKGEPVNYYSYNLTPIIENKIESQLLSIVPIKTGRFWGFSYNLDFEAMQRGLIDNKDLKQLKPVLHKMNDCNLETITKHLKSNCKRSKKQLKAGKISKKKYKYKIDKAIKTYENQKRRHAINHLKIENGYSVQFEINYKRSIELRDFEIEKTVSEFFKKSIGFN